MTHKSLRNLLFNHDIHRVKLHKRHKQWLAIGMTTLMLAGFGAPVASTITPINADTTASISETQPTDLSSGYFDNFGSQVQSGFNSQTDYQKFMSDLANKAPNVLGNGSNGAAWANYFNILNRDTQNTNDGNSTLSDFKNNIGLAIGMFSSRANNMYSAQTLEDKVSEYSTGFFSLLSNDQANELDSFFNGLSNHQIYRNEVKSELAEQQKQKASATASASTAAKHAASSASAITSKASSVVKSANAKVSSAQSAAKSTASIASAKSSVASSAQSTESSAASSLVPSSSTAPESASSAVSVSSANDDLDWINDLAKLNTSSSVSQSFPKSASVSAKSSIAAKLIKPIRRNKVMKRHIKRHHIVKQYSIKNRVRKQRRQTRLATYLNKHYWTNSSVKHSRRIVVTRFCKLYRVNRNHKRVAVRYLYRGDVVHVGKVFRYGHTNKFIVGKHTYVTANRKFVKVLHHKSVVKHMKSKH